MGRGAMMRVHNTCDRQITTRITAVTCMYDHAQGSKLSAFDNATIPPGTAWPEAGPQYIESDDSAFSPCSSETSGFLLKVDHAGLSVAIVESGGRYSAAAASPDSKVTINNDGNPSTIDIELDPWFGPIN